MGLSFFYGSYENFESIPTWDDEEIPSDFFHEPEPKWHQLDHGYDETKTQLDLSDLQAAAKFRGGQCLSKQWNGDMYTRMKKEIKIQTVE